MPRLRATYDVVDEKVRLGGEGKDIELSTTDKDKSCGLVYF